ncbi:Leucine carboxyl methyltransferase 2 [Gryganskiella cystojenkinii]|nr:Leucine carboxyl methyltransferase 2 [Gryganskiella cystojenkinii]
MNGTGDEATDLAIQGTNTSSITSKRSLERLGYLEPCHVPNVTERDSPLMLKYVVPKPSRRSPVINRAYYQRTESIRMLVEGWVEACETKGVEACAVVSLGCGFDPTFFRLATLKSQEQDSKTKLKYIDIDYPTLITERLYMIRNEEKLFHLLPQDPTEDDVGSFVSDTYSCMGVDLRNLGQLESALQSAGVEKTDQNMPILVISEVVLAYLGPEESDAVIQFFARYPSATFILHEQCVPTFDSEEPDENLHPFAVTMFRHFERTMTPLKTLQEYRSLEDHRDRLQRLGWQQCDILNMNLFTDYAVMPTAEEHQRICVLEPFDEYDELFWIGAYYFIAVASTGSPETNPDVLEYIGLRAKLSDAAALAKAHVDQSSYVTVGDCTNIPVPAASASASASTSTSTSTSTSAALAPSSFKVNASSPSKPISWSAQTPFPGLEINRKGHTLTVLGDKAFVFGGFGLDSADETRDSEKQRVFQTRSQQQTRLGSMIHLDLKTGTSRTIPKTEDGPAPRMHHATCANLAGTVMYLYGGRDGPSKVHNDVWRFTPEEGWEPLWRGRMSLGEESPMAPKGLYKHTANIMRVAGREMMVVVGGCVSTGDADNLIYAFDLEEGQWGRFMFEDMNSLLPDLFSHSTVVIPDVNGENDHLIIIGGIRAHDEKVLNGVWKVTLSAIMREYANGQQRQCCLAAAKEISIRAIHGESLTPRFGHTAVLVEPDQIWVMGGVSAPGLLQWHETVIEINPSEGLFTPIKLSSFKEMVMVGHATAFDSSRGRIIGVGGGGTCFGFGAWWDDLSWALRV